MARFHSTVLCIAALIVAGCGSTETNNRPHPPYREFRPSPTLHIASKPDDAGDAPKMTDEPALPPAPLNIEKSETRNSTPPHPDSDEAPLKIFLEPDVANLAVPLPTSKLPPEKYRSWHQKERIFVGQTHLDTAALSPDERLVLVMSEVESTVRVYDLKSRALVGNFSVDGFEPDKFERGDVTFWPDQERGPAFVVGNRKGIALYSATTGERISTFSDRPVWNIKWSKDGRYLFCSEADISNQTSMLTIFERTSGPGLLEIKRAQLPERIDGWTLSADDRFFAATYYPSDTLKLVDLHTGETLWSIEAPTYSNSVDISPDNSRLAIGGDRLIVVDRQAPTKRAVYEKFGNNIHEVRFSPSGDAVAVSSYDGHVRILSADPSAKSLRLYTDLRHGGTANVYSIVYLKNGEGLVSSSGDKTVRLWGR